MPESIDSSRKPGPRLGSSWTRTYPGPTCEALASSAYVRLLAGRRPNFQPYPHMLDREDGYTQVVGYGGSHLRWRLRWDPLGGA